MSSKVKLSNEKTGYEDLEKEAERMMKVQ